MPKKTLECPTCGAALPIIKGEVQSCPECGMPLEGSGLELEEVEEGNEEEEDEDYEDEDE